MAFILNRSIIIDVAAGRAPVGRLPSAIAMDSLSEDELLRFCSGIVNSISSEERSSLDPDLRLLLEEICHFAAVISIRWSANDVMERCEHLNPIEAMHVLDCIERDLDGNSGVTWETIDEVANDLYPDLVGEDGSGDEA